MYEGIVFYFCYKKNYAMKCYFFPQYADILSRGLTCCLVLLKHITFLEAI